MKRLLQFLLFLVLIISSQIVYADVYNNRNQIIGERAAMMGGAYTALSEDSSGTFYNPAGTAFIDRTMISITANVYHYMNYKRKNEQAGYDFENKLDYFETIPTSFGVSYRLSEKFVLSISIYQVDRFDFKNTEFNSGKSQSLTIEVSASSWIFGPSVSYKILDNLSIGVNTFFHYSRGRFMSYWESDFEFETSANEYSSIGFIPEIGIKWNVIDNFKIGMKYGVETVNIDGKSKSMIRTSYTPSYREVTDGDARLPHTLTMGIAYEKKGSYAVAFDFTYYFKMKYSNPYEMFRIDSIDNYHEERNHFNISLGGEYFVTKAISLRAGFFTNTSGATEKIASEKVDMYGGSLGFGYISDKISTSLGLIMQYGKSGAQSSDSQVLLETIEASWKRFSIGVIFGGTTKI
ncbi:OmpP1/FadL family transporter [Spirochaetota bacterium]